MTHLVLRRNVSNEDAFAKAVQMYASELQSHRAHMANVAAGNADPYPAPTAHPEIVASVNTVTTQPDYQLVDFLPVERGDIKALELRKDELRHQVQMMEAQAKHNILPAGKWRWAGLEYERAKSTPEAVRTPNDFSIIRDHEARSINLKALQLHHARLEAQVEDLSFDTINSWTPQPFGG